ncbi:hypothetical protein [Microbacterium sp. BLY]|uniref:hypothetical protein n=1 Tax=Microbacterium sp. BLY TaxID=2823280 RepID=UPI001B33FEFA|nr:hypothetical protein [Microbacterium sp. BLY]MBP3978689.1 hypothetical protein [Microbacterium sp. BLY]
MERQGDRDFTRMSVDTRQEISESILDAVAEFDLVIAALFRDGVGSPESRAAGFVREDHDVTSQGSEPMRSALRSILFSVLAGMDHVRLFASSLTTPNPSVGLATLNRGAIEAYARAWWLMNAQSGAQLLTRWLSGLAKELNQAVSLSPDVRIQEMRGGQSTPQELLTLVMADIQHVSPSGRPEGFNYTGLASAISDHINENGRTLYSHLSAVAHGESLGINGFFGIDDDRGVFVHGITERFALNYAEQVFSVTSVVFGELIEFMGYGRSGSERWAVAHDRANDVLIREHTRINGQAPIQRVR